MADSTVSDLIYGDIGTADENVELLTQEAVTEVKAAQGLLAVGASQAACAGDNKKQPPQDGKGKYIRSFYAKLENRSSAHTLSLFQRQL